jgi:Holliday junction resolvase RusA-like endonuclease
MIVLDVSVPGEPVGKGRPIFSRATGTARTPEKTVAWEEKARQHAARVWPHAPMPRDVPVVVEVEAVAGRPQRLLGKRAEPGRLPHLGKPDIDNTIKACLDSLVLAGVLEDDTSVWRCVGVKEYAAIGELPHVRVRVYSDVAPVAKVAPVVPSWEGRGTCDRLTGVVEREDGGALVVSVRHTCQRPACEARRWRVVRLSLDRRPEAGDRIVTFAPGEVVR